MEIVSECLATIFICIFTVMHFDIPPKPADTRTCWRWFRTGGWIIWSHRVVEWLFGLLALEVFAVSAALEYLMAARDCAVMRENGCHRWTLKLSFFAGMGGFQVDDQILRSGEEVWRYCQIHFNGHMPNLEALGDDVDDKCKADGLGKSLALLQICRFLAGIVTRVAASLPVSPLEYVTCGYVSCAIVIYAFWFHKPSGAKSPIHLRHHPLCDPEPTKNEGKSNRATPTSTCDYAKSMSATDRCKCCHLRLSCWHSYLADLSQCSFPTLTVIALAIGVALAIVLGASHLGSWNIEFPNTKGRALWRACSICMFLPVLVFVYVFFASIHPRCRNITPTRLFVLVALVYVPARLILFYLLVYSFTSLPAGVYDTTNVAWLEYIPFLH